LFMTHLRRDWFDKVREACIGAFLLCLLFASCDEYRQNLMPNREGSIRDVSLDMVAVVIVLFLTQRRHKNQAAQL
jgi:VanZ family protein